MAEHQIHLAHPGVIAIGEKAFADRIAYGIPDVLGLERATYSGKKVFSSSVAAIGRPTRCSISRPRVKGPPHTLDLGGTRRNVARVFGGGAADKLPARGKLGSDLKH